MNLLGILSYGKYTAVTHSNARVVPNVFLRDISQGSTLDNTRALSSARVAPLASTTSKVLHTASHEEGKVFLHSIYHGRNHEGPLLF